MRKTKFVDYYYACSREAAYGDECVCLSVCLHAYLSKHTVLYNFFNFLGYYQSPTVNATQTI